MEKKNTLTKDVISIGCLQKLGRDTKKTCYAEQSN